jgi:(E)-4-hydroxy-3-methylbut-2-enyl-diphosphate synthase
MTKTDTRDVKSTVKQIQSLQKAGCEIIRIAVPDMEAATALGGIKKSVTIPVIADIHFDWRLALEAIRQGVDVADKPGQHRCPMEGLEVVSAAPDRHVRYGSA